ncbi:PREDICTED: uncharacterized protein LOC101300576 isoform X7 [Fragaria vesca subsp. vesca]|uniref:uncharacterized protein LOC101300576 isoform X7 n=1 Tax=Fragaria vesca subsp. vesca TaxID=101020 RepID=UPI0002C328A1|nr:PREDICTED: uncharacterized protein LOC101300576 isoform X7 [Fragaria vesca subsp. vesca]
MGRSRASTRLSSSNNNKDPKPSQQDLINDASSLVSSASDDKLSEDALNQVDQFLREALQNPRERLSSGRTWLWDGNSTYGGVCSQCTYDIDTYYIREPLGVRVRICPFNIPSMIPL